MQDGENALRALHHAAIRAINDSATLAEGARAVLAAVCADRGWSGGEYWQVDAEDRSVERLVVWSSPALSASPPARELLSDAAPGPLPLASGLPGAVPAGESEVWIGDLTARPGDPHRAELARRAGLTTAVTVPVPDRAGPGVLLFFTPDPAEANSDPDSDRLLLALQSIGTHVAQFAECCRSREALEVSRNEIARSESMLRAILANSQSLIYVKDLHGRYLMANDVFLRTRSVTAADLIGRDDTSIDPRMAPIWQANDQRAQEGRYSVEEWYDGPDGRVWYDSVKFPLHDAEGRLYATCGISLDVTAQRRAAVAMEEARDAALAATEAKSSFLATMSHEIRTPMTAVIGMTDLLLDTDLDVRQQEFLQTIRTSGDALLSIINDILDFSRLEAGEMELEERPFDLRRCVEDSLALVAGTATRIDLVADVEPGLPQFVVGDVNRLRQVLVNLVGNAIKFTDHGDVLLSVRRADQAGDTEPTDGVDLRFSVRDTGIGIPAERMDRLFKSFSQVDTSTTRVYGGSGLGLAISRAIVQAMGSDIGVRSEVGVGSTFSFDVRLGRCDDPGEVDGTEMIDGAVDLSGRRVLVVDDNDTNRRILQEQLESWGVSCSAIASAADAVPVLRDEPGFDVAILDMHMPETDGVELAEQIRRHPEGRHLPLILLTSLDAKPPGAVDLFAGYHTKPIRAGELRTMLGRILAPRHPVVPGPAGRPPHLGHPGHGAGPAGQPRSDPTSLRILLAEDNAVNQMVAQRLLHTLGHFVDIAGNGQEAFEAVQKRDYDVVLMDIHMPTMDGLDATRAIRVHIPAHRQPRIVAMTASSLPEDRKACHDAGMNGYLLKPVRLADLVESLQAVAALPAAAIAAVPAARRPADDTPARRPDAAEPTSSHGPSSPASSPGSLSSGAATQAPARAVDLGVLSRLTTDMGATSAPSRHALIEAYLDQADVWIRDLVVAGRRNDRAKVRTIAHTLGSSSALLGAQPLADLLERAGQAAREEDADLLTPVAEVEYEYRLVSMVLRANYESLGVGEEGAG
jgi:PAS domain S-box-containing protein